MPKRTRGWGDLLAGVGLALECGPQTLNTRGRWSQTAVTLDDSLPVAPFGLERSLCAETTV